jgi:predicted ATP-grasp superfamily ATP-dependent carboligase
VYRDASMRRVLVVGVSTRAAADSAARAGFDVTAIDAFGDLDHHRSVDVRSIPRNFGAPFSARAAARAAGTIDCDAVVYLSNFENHPRAVSALANGRELWGNAPPILRRVRDPGLLARALRRRGCATPDVFLERDAASIGAGHPCNDAGDLQHPLPGRTKWLVKPLASGGGHRIRPYADERCATTGARGDALVPRGCYLQELIDGIPGSVVFVAAGGRAVPLGVSRQLVGEAAFGATAYRYCGNILAAHTDWDDSSIVNRAATLARAVAEEFGVVGVNGIDFVVRDGVPLAIEVNPRWSASMELVERAHGFSVFEAHAAACVRDVLPTVDLTQARPGAGAVGKAVIFARRDVVVGDTMRWLADGTVRDIPYPGERIPAGQPVCTVFADGRDTLSCRLELVRRAQGIYAELDNSKRGPDVP